MCLKIWTQLPLKEPMAKGNPTLYSEVIPYVLEPYLSVCSGPPVSSSSVVTVEGDCHQLWGTCHCSLLFLSLGMESSRPWDLCATELPKPYHKWLEVSGSWDHKSTSQDLESWFLWVTSKEVSFGPSLEFGHTDAEVCAAETKSTKSWLLDLSLRQWNTWFCTTVI